MTYGTLISTQTIGAGGAASIDFTSIPQTYTDLLLVTSIRNASGTDVDTFLKINGVTTSFTTRAIEGAGSGSASSWTRTNNFGASASGTTNTFASIQGYFPNYASTTTNKTYSVESTPENNTTVVYTHIIAGSWASTSAITSLSVYFTSGNVAQYSTASLYGIK